MNRRESDGDTSSPPAMVVDDWCRETDFLLRAEFYIAADACVERVVLSVRFATLTKSYPVAASASSAMVAGYPLSTTSDPPPRQPVITTSTASAIRRPLISGCIISVGSVV
jgi:hypothetical protein